MLPCERKFHKDVERTEKYVWKSPKEIRRAIMSAFSKYKNDNILPAADHEYPAITSRTKMALLKSIVYKYEVDAAKKKVACEIKETQVDMSKQQLESMLLSESLPYKGTTTRLQNRCRNNGLPVKKTVKTGVMLPWMGQTKGLQQILLERGKVNMDEISKYSERGKKDRNGKIIESTSYQLILGACLDYKNEKSILEAIAERTGVLIKPTPKYHCELAGEGIEYSWGFAKLRYRRVPLEERNSAVKFRAFVAEALDAVSKDRMRRFSRRARLYVCSYYVKHHGLDKTEDEVINAEEVAEVDANISRNSAAVDGGSLHNKSVNIKIELKDIARMIKSFRSHRCSLDFDGAFIERESQKM